MEHILCLNELTVLRVYRTHHFKGFNSPLANIIIVCLIALSIIAIVLSRKVLKNKMISAIGAENEADYKNYKQNCLFNFKNKLCISPDWIINEYSLTVHPSAELKSAEIMKNKTAPGGTNRICLQLTYTSCFDEFGIANHNDSEYIVRNINEYIECRNNGTTFVQENYINRKD